LFERRKHRRKPSAYLACKGWHASRFGTHGELARAARDVCTCSWGGVAIIVETDQVDDLTRPRGVQRRRLLAQRKVVGRGHALEPYPLQSAGEPLQGGREHMFLKLGPVEITRQLIGAGRLKGLGWFYV